MKIKADLNTILLDINAQTVRNGAHLNTEEITILTSLQHFIFFWLTIKAVRI